MTHSHFNKKIFAIGLGLFLATNFLAITAVYAAPYVPLAPLPIGEGGASLTEVTNAGVYIKGAFNLAIGIAAALAIIMIIIGGIQYMGSESLGGKSAGRKRINDAVLGLLLALGSYLILFTINPSLVDFNVNIGAITPPAGGTTPTPPPVNPGESYAYWSKPLIFKTLYTLKQYTLASNNNPSQNFTTLQICRDEAIRLENLGSQILIRCVSRPKTDGDGNIIINRTLPYNTYNECKNALVPLQPNETIHSLCQPGSNAATSEILHGPYATPNACRVAQQGCSNTSSCIVTTPCQLYNSD